MFRILFSRSKQQIKDAIMGNDFLKHIDSSQVRELVDSMYRRDVVQGEYVIREGEGGAHLFVAAEGEFEVIKDGKVLGKMGPGKAFGELAILYIIAPERHRLKVRVSMQHDIKDVD